MANITLHWLGNKIIERPFKSAALCWLSIRIVGRSQRYQSEVSCCTSLISACRLDLAVWQRLDWHVTAGCKQWLSLLQLILGSWLGFTLQGSWITKLSCPCSHGSILKRGFRAKSFKLECSTADLGSRGFSLYCKDCCTELQQYNNWIVSGQTEYCRISQCPLRKNSFVTTKPRVEVWRLVVTKRKSLSSL